MFRPEHRIIMAGLLAYFLQNAFPSNIPGSKKKIVLLPFGTWQWQGCSEHNEDHSSGYCPGF